MKTNFKLLIEYDGTPFSGWQVQNNCITVQGELEKTLSIILNRKIRITGSGRTDAGVHAAGQVANFHADTGINCKDLKKGLNSMIKSPIVIKDCCTVPNDFHARFNAVSKEYHYHILNRHDPVAIGRDYIWHIKRPLDLSAINQCCKQILGSHDFKSFEAAGSPRPHTVREIFWAGMEKIDKEKLVFKIKANGFLRFMVRNILGTLVLAGLSKITPEDFGKILYAKDRSLAGATAPAGGLILFKVAYS